MKIYSNTLTGADLDAAIRAANEHAPETMADDPFYGCIGFQRCRELPRPRIRARGWNVLLYRIGSTMHFNTGQYGAGEDGAASWDDWGWFLAELFRRDPVMRAGYYDGEADFHRTTHDAFRPETEGGIPRLTSAQARSRLGGMGLTEAEARQLLAGVRRTYAGKRVRSGAGTAYVVTYLSLRYQITPEDRRSGPLTPERMGAAIADMQRVQRNLDADRQTERQPDPIVFGT